MQVSRVPGTALVVIGLIMHDDQVLLVQQQGRRDPAAYWVAPGGLVEPGEAIATALHREMREETGLQVIEVGPLASTTQIDHPERDARTLAFAFIVTGWSGVPLHADPDAEILDVRWFPRADAIAVLHAIGWRGMRDPLLAYLTGQVPLGTFWHYTERDGVQHLEPPGAYTER